jgi:Short C-terminal domain
VNEARELIGATAAAPGSAAPSDIPAQLRQVADLRDAGVISPNDFDAKKAELLARL